MATIQILTATAEVFATAEVPDDLLIEGEDGTKKRHEFETVATAKGKAESFRATDGITDLYGKVELGPPDHFKPGVFILNRIQLEPGNTIKARLQVVSIKEGSSKYL